MKEADLDGFLSGSFLSHATPSPAMLAVFRVRLILQQLYIYFLMAEIGGCDLYSGAT